MKVFTTFIIMLICLSANAQITTSEILGKWKMVTKTPIGDKKQTFTIQFQNDRLIGLTKNGKVEISIDENQLSWENSVKTPIGKIDIQAIGHLEKDGVIAGFSSPISGKMKGKKLSWVMRKM